MAEADQLGHRGAGNVHHRNRVVFLAGDVGGFGIFADGNVFRFQVLGNARARAEDADARIQHRAVKGVKIRRGSHCRSHAAADVHHRHRAFRIDSVIVIRFALVGGQHVHAVRGEGDHIRQRAGHHIIEKIAVSIEEDHLAGGLLVVVFHRGGDHAVMHVDAVGLVAVGGKIDREQQGGIGRIADIQHIDQSAGAIDHKQPLGGGIMGHDLGSALGEDAGGISAQRLQGDALGQHTDGHRQDADDK